MERRKVLVEVNCSMAEYVHRLARLSDAGEEAAPPVKTSSGRTSRSCMASSLTNGAFQYCLAAELAIDLACIIDPAFPGIYNTGTPSG